MASCSFGVISTRLFNRSSIAARAFEIRWVILAPSDSRIAATYAVRHTEDARLLMGYFSRRFPISDARPLTSRTPCSRAPLLVWSVRGQLGDRPSRDSPQQPDGHAQLARETLRLVDVIGLAFSLVLFRSYELLRLRRNQTASMILAPAAFISYHHEPDRYLSLTQNQLFLFLW
jgi:hypothetical protein